MNLLLLQHHELTTSDRALVTGQRAHHLVNTLKVATGQEIKAGFVNGKTGTAKILSVAANRVELALSLNKEPPAPLPVTLILALPRPKMLRRILQTVATMGIKELYLINSWRVEKSYWQSPFLTEKSIHQQLLLGLEQGVDTLLPRVYLKKRFKPFVEDELKAIVGSTTALVAHPSATSACPVGFNQPLTLAIGPEGGFIDYEVNHLMDAGFQAVTLGQRILRVETAIPAILGRLFT